MILWSSMKLSILEKQKKKTGGSNEIFYFTDQHPGHKYAYVQKRTKEVVPMISSENGFPDLDSLQMDKGNVTFLLTDNRERYAKVALALIFSILNIGQFER